MVHLLHKSTPVVASFVVLKRRLNGVLSLVEILETYAFFIDIFPNHWNRLNIPNSLPFRPFPMAFFDFWCSFLIPFHSIHCNSFPFHHPWTHHWLFSFLQPRFHPSILISPCHFCLFFSHRTFHSSLSLRTQFPPSQPVVPLPCSTIIHSSPSFFVTSDHHHFSSAVLFWSASSRLVLFPVFWQRLHFMFGFTSHDSLFVDSIGFLHPHSMVYNHLFAMVSNDENMTRFHLQAQAFSNWFVCSLIHGIFNTFTQLNCVFQFSTKQNKKWMRQIIPQEPRLFSRTSHPTTTSTMGIGLLEQFEEPSELERKWLVVAVVCPFLPPLDHLQHILVESNQHSVLGCIVPFPRCIVCFLSSQREINESDLDQCELLVHGALGKPN